MFLIIENFALCFICQKLFNEHILRRILSSVQITKGRHFINLVCTRTENGAPPLNSLACAALAVRNIRKILYIFHVRTTTQ